MQGTVANLFNPIQLLYDEEDPMQAGINHALQNEPLLRRPGT
jgi:hypothetical protein